MSAAPPPLPPPPAHPMPFRLLPTKPSSWDPATAVPTLNVRLDGCIVPSEASNQGARISYSHAVVIDDFIDDGTRQQLLDFLMGPPSVHPCTDVDATDGATAEQARVQPGDPQQQTDGKQQAAPHPSLSDRWERRTTDMAGAAPTWGVKQAVLEELAKGQLPALQEVHARICKLYPECDIAHLPSDAIQLAQQGVEQQQTVEEQTAKRAKLGAPSTRPGTTAGRCSGGGAAPVDCACFVANAAVGSDSYAFHVDADPTSFPDGSPWHALYGDYFNGEPGRPLLVSLLLYLNPEWRREWGAETLLLDGQTDTGVFVAPRPCRALLFDQDILHRVSPPTAAAGNRARFSLVWKLALLPRQAGQAPCVARPEWGPPASVGSAARVDAVKRQILAEHRQQQSRA